MLVTERGDGWSTAGLCLISVPKSGTMFLSRYLERLTDLPVVFGLEDMGAGRLASEIRGRLHPAVAAALSPSSCSTEAMARRFAGMLARNRKEVEARAPGEARLYSDHGFHNFLRFLVAPLPDEVIPPADIIGWAERRGLRVCYLHRSLGAVAVSLAHFLASGKSFLLSAKSLDAAMDMVVEAHVPVLAALMDAWVPFRSDPRVVTLAYEDLTARPADHIPALMAACGLSAVDRAGIIENSEQYRSWTWRSGRKPSWRDGVSARHQRALDTNFGHLLGQ